ncbi:hypothetical protein MKJ04_03445 [Pontibacter sp. E15-1]|uniref:hypothetical protein n=1 Tax=Pontibacter sp. E15-1 TaxID=2919918 RepID=UPI001F4F6EC9|nr:hypothetical protein [Pontibacter sp. E15-1]MCJ8163881.1 hypothetical protein [Pontibacter sp. E15-1]
MKSLPLFILLLLCSCVTSRKVKDYLAREKNQSEAKAIVADWLEQHKDWYTGKAAQDFPIPESVPIPEPVRVPAASKSSPTDSIPCPEAAIPIPIPISISISIPILRRPPPKAACPDTSLLMKTLRAQELALKQIRADTGAAQAALHDERAAHAATRQQLRQTEAEREYWKDKNRKKFWALIVMGVCGVLYVVFKALAARVRTT